MVSSADARPEFSLDLVIETDFMPRRWIGPATEATAFLIPRPLLDLLTRRIGFLRFDRDALRVELQYTRGSPWREMSAGVFHDVVRGGYVPLFHEGLSGKPPADSSLATLSAKQKREDLAWSHEQESSLFSRLPEIVAADRTAWIEDLGFIGWLVSNETFLREQKTLFEAHGAIFDQLGIHRFPLGALRHYGLTCGEQTTRATVASEAVVAFCTRWNLSSLLGRFVPVSKGSLRQPDPYLPRPITGDATNMLMDPSDPIALALALPEARRLDPLYDWKETVSAGSSSRKTIPRFARYFVFQHYYRLLMARHKKVLAGRQGAVLEVLAEYLNGFPEADPGLLGTAEASTLNRTDLQPYRRWSKMELY